MIIGVTGGIGSGKSTVAKVLADFGACVIDADTVGHAVYEPGTEGWKKLVAEFGPGIIGNNGTIDRPKLGALVFSDPQRLARLNALIHPLIGAEMSRRIDTIRGHGHHGPIVIEAAVMIEAGWDSLVDELWVIVASREAILARLSRQRGLSAPAIEARMESQLSEEERCRHATVVLDNSGSPEELKRQLEGLWQDRVIRCCDRLPN